MQLIVRGISVAFGRVRAVRSVDLEVGSGEVMAIFGTNGSGKTAFLKAVAGLVPVSSGEIRWAGEDITCLPVRDRVARGIHYVSDRARVALRMTVRENLDAGGYLEKTSRREASRGRVYELFPALREKAKSPAGVLSGGERQMLVVGRALMGNPSLFLFDEPFLGLSLSVRDRILAVIARELKGRATVLLAEHDLGAAFQVLDRYCIFLDGKRIHEGRKSDVDTEERLQAEFRRFHRGTAGGSAGREAP